MFERVKREGSAKDMMNDTHEDLTWMIDAATVKEIDSGFSA